MTGGADAGDDDDDGDNDDDDGDAEMVMAMIKSLHTSESAFSVMAKEPAVAIVPLYVSHCTKVKQVIM